MTFGEPPRNRILRVIWRAGIRPRFRMRELSLLAAVALTLGVGWVSLASTRAGGFSVGRPGPLLVYLGALLAVHVAFVISGRRMDQVLLPAVGLLGGLSLLLMARLPGKLVTRTVAGVRLDLLDLQLLWLLLGLAVLGAVAVLLRRDGWLRDYKYTWAAAGIGLLLLVFVLGDETNGARLSITLGPLTGQPSELLKVVLVIFLAAYLADNRSLLAARSTRVGFLRLPPLPYLLPLLAMWGLAIAVVVVQKDLGAAFLFFAVFLALLYIATRRAIYVLAGLALFLGAAAVLVQLYPHVRLRVDVWLDPTADPLGSGFQALRALYAFGRGGILGTGLGAGLPEVGGGPAIPALHTDFAFAALGEELGLAGAIAICALFLIIGERGLRIAARARDEFGALLAAGLTLVIVLQAAVIIAGNLKLVPLTGITLPFVSYGGSSILANGLVVGMLLALSDRSATRVMPGTVRLARRSSTAVHPRSVAADPDAPGIAA
ncbi:MAG: FtsW/RodA/SpoVE family cell cycle protein [Chloroflexota bacterium]